MLLLARLMTAITAALAAVIYLVIEMVEQVRGRDIAFDQHLLNWRLWGLIFIFWTSIMAGMREALHLHK